MSENLFQIIISRTILRIETDSERDFYDIIDVWNKKYILS